MSQYTSLKLKPIKNNPPKKAAPIWKRILATLIDYLIFALPIFINFKHNTNWICMEVVISTIGIIGILYKVLMTYRFGGTVGKLVMGIRVVNRQLQRVALKQTILRVMVDTVLQLLFWGIKIQVITEIGVHNYAPLSNVERGRLIVDTSEAYPVYMIVNHAWSISSILSVLINSDNRALHDFIAGTIVVNKEYAQGY